MAATNGLPKPKSQQQSQLQPQSQSQTRPSTPLTATFSSQHGVQTPRSQFSTSFASSPQPSSANMQRSSSSKSGPRAATATTPTPLPGTFGAQKVAAAKTVPGKSSAGKGVIGAGSPMVRSGSTNTSVGAGDTPRPHSHAAGPTSTPGSAKVAGALLDASSPGMAAGLSGSGASGFDSPALGASFAALVGGVDMRISLSNMSQVGSRQSGGTNTIGGRIDDGERKRRLELILDTLRRRPGRLSRSAIERLARRCGLDLLRDGVDKISLAGKNAVMIDLQFEPGRSPLAKHVQLTYATESAEIAAWADRGASILQQDLVPPADIPSTLSRLDKFADNLERLARMDKISGSGANCFEGVNGIFVSLKKLFEKEKSTADNANKTNLSAESMVLCHKSGCPRMHVNKRVGLSLLYWRSRRYIAPIVTEKPKRKPAFKVRVKQEDHDSPMEVDGATPASSHHPEDDEEEHSDTSALVIECEYSPPALYSPFRTSRAWLSDRVLKPPSELDTATLDLLPSEPVIEWQDPPSGGPVHDSDKTMTDTNGDVTQVPHARFVAHLEPPIILPLQTALRIYSAVDIELLNTNETIQPTTFDAIYPAGHLRRVPATTLPLQLRLITATRSIPGALDGTDADYSVNAYLPPLPQTQGEEPGVNAVRISKLPFSHPKQLVEILPVLRQWTVVGDILRNSLASVEPNDESSAASSPKDKTSSQRTSTATPAIESTNDEDDLQAFLNASSAQSAPRTLDILFRPTTHAEPRISVHFPTTSGLKHATIAVGLNGTVKVIEQNIIGRDTPTRRQTNDTSSSNESESRGVKRKFEHVAHGSADDADKSAENEREKRVKIENGDKGQQLDEPKVKSEDNETVANHENVKQTAETSATPEPAAPTASNEGHDDSQPHNPESKDTQYDPLTRGLETVEDVVMWVHWIREVVLPARASQPTDARGS